MEEEVMLADYSILSPFICFFEDLKPHHHFELGRVGDEK